MKGLRQWFDKLISRAVAMPVWGVVALLLALLFLDFKSSPVMMSLAIGLAFGSDVMVTGFWNALKMRMSRGGARDDLPASLICYALELMMSKKHFERVIEPLIADWHAEYFEEVDGQNRPAKFFFMRIRYLYALALELLGAVILERIKDAVAGLFKAQ